MIQTKFRNLAQNAQKLFRANLKLIFAQHFIYFLIAALTSFILITLIIVLNSETMPTPATIYGLLLFPGMLLIFYPCTYGIQLDLDAGMLETLFGIPNYRYKVWLIRLGIAYLVVAFILLLLAGISHYFIASIPVFKMVFHLLFPLLFLGSLAFLFATLTRSGHGAAVLIIVFGFGLWLFYDTLQNTRWNLYHNPFTESSSLNPITLNEITFYNRAIMLAGAIIAVLWGLLNLQRREKFMQ
jgi:hypothetical protein